MKWCWQSAVLGPLVSWYDQSKTSHQKCASLSMVELQNYLFSQNIMKLGENLFSLKKDVSLLQLILPTLG